MALSGRPPMPGIVISWSSSTRSTSATPNCRLSRSAWSCEDAEALAEVVGDLVAGDGDDGGVADRLVLEDGDVGRAAADVDERDADLLLVVVEHGVD